MLLDEDLLVKAMVRPRRAGQGSKVYQRLTLVDVRRVGLLAGLGPLLLVAGARSLLRGILLLSGSLRGASRGLGGGLLVSGLRGHFCGRVCD